MSKFDASILQYEDEMKIVTHELEINMKELRMVIHIALLTYPFFEKTKNW